MISALLVSVTLMAAPDVSAEEMARYEAARAQVGRDSEAQVKLALWCEGHGLTAKKVEHLALALMADPANTSARGLMGLMKDGARWRKPEEVSKRVRLDARQAQALAEYNQRRARTRMTARDQWNLAVWCEEQGLEPEAQAHFSSVVRLDPSRSAAWRRLGCEKHHGRWMTKAQIEKEIAEVQAQAKADRDWMPRLDRIKTRLKKDKERAEAERELAQVEDPRAVRSVWKVFAKGSKSDQRVAVQVLGQIDAVMASQGLARLAIQGETDAVRRAATESLVGRDQREYLDGLVALVHKPIEYEMRPVNDGSGTLELFVEGERYNVARFYRLPQIPRNFRFSLNPYANLSYNDRLALQSRTTGSFGLTTPQNVRTSERLMNEAMAGERDLERREAIAAYNQNEIRKEYLSREMQIEKDVAGIQMMNGRIRRLNQRLLPVLETVTKQSFGTDPDAWRKWWTEAKGYAYEAPRQEKPTFVSNELAYTPRLDGRFYTHSACFARGTPVLTLEGSKAIETIQTGDQVLTQDVETGELSYQPVLAPVQNPPSRLFRVELGTETIEATGIHRFWKAGEGWAMVRDLKPGDRVRTVGGVAEVQAVSGESTQPVFNLDVAENRDYFVGKTGFLAHDNSVIEPVDRPFDRVPELAR